MNTGACTCARTYQCNIPKQPIAQSHAPVITAYANKPLCLLHVHHYSKCTGA